jgi:peptidyl-prolyl cis-trans isomerase SurA
VKSKLVTAALSTIVAFMFLPAAARAQEGEPVVVDEVIAQVNDGVVTLSQLKREMKERVDTLKQNGMTEQQANTEVQAHKAELISILISEQLLLQKGKELDFTEKVEAEVNKRMLETAKENGITSMDKLCEAMTQAGLSCEDVRRTLRTEIMKQAVFEGEVDSKLFYGFSMDELHKYFDTHRDKFLKPESVELSEIFLSLAGKPEADVKARADQLVDQLRKGADFGTLAVAYSERQANGQRSAPQNKGKVGLFQVSDLRTDIAAAIKNVKAGGVSDPLKSDEGYQILRVDVRTAGSNSPAFNENNVRLAMTSERSPKAHEEFLQKLRDDAFIKVAKDYNESVQPLLKVKQDFLVERSGDGSTSKPEKKKGKILGIFPRP